jgi:hypothetical protein
MPPCSAPVSSRDAQSGRCNGPDSARGNPGAPARPARNHKPATIPSPPYGATGLDVGDGVAGDLRCSGLV